MELLITVVLLLVLLIPLAVSIRRATDLFILEADDGQVRFVRGRIPQSLLDEISDVLVRSKSTGRLRVFVERREARIDARGDFTPGTLQQLRNVIGNVPLQRIRAGGRRAGR